MTLCKHCGKEMVLYENDGSWYTIGEDDQWVHTHVVEDEDDGNSSLH